MQCMMCFENVDETRYINLYVIGSEGLEVCHKCEMELVYLIRKIRSDNMTKRINKRLTERRISNEQER